MTTLRGTLKSLAWLAGLATALLAAPLQAKVNGVTGPSFNLVAQGDFISAADGIMIYNWGYGVAGSRMQYPGPTLIVNQNAAVSVTLTNNLPTRTSIVFPGQSGVTCTGCIAGTGAAAPEINPGAVATYSFTASSAGTFTYHSGSQMDVQIEMGLMGALIVRPTGFSAGTTAGSRAYDTTDSQFTPNREYLLMLSEIDGVRHQAVYDQVIAPGAKPVTWRVDTSSFGAYAPRYWWINGRNSPDTLGKAFAPELPTQPYNSLVQMHPGNKVLLRMVNMGRDLHPFHHHGNNTWTIARDGRLLRSTPGGTSANLAQSDFTLRMVPGQTLDAIWEWTGAGLNWDIYGHAPGSPCLPNEDCADHGKPLPVALPSELNLTYGEMFSGNPFLGAPGSKPVGAGLANTTNGYFHMMHSHNEKELINDGVFPGGMMTMVLIQPPNVSISAND